MGNTASQTIVLDDGTAMGNAGTAFAKAFQRMHSILRDCDEEFRIMSDTANEYGRKSEQFTTAVANLDACQRRRANDLTSIERHCGPSQEAFRLCIQQNSNGRESLCLAILQEFLDCADDALKMKSS